MDIKGEDRRRKHFLLDQSLLDQAKEILGARTETETIERAIDRILDEDRRIRQTWADDEKFIRSMS